MNTPARASRFLWSGAAAVAPQLTTFLLTRPLIGRLGHAGFGAWVLVLTTVTIAAGSDLGLTGSITRFLAVHRGTGDRAAATRLMTTALLTAVLLVGVIDGVVLAAGPSLTHHVIGHGDVARAVVSALPAIAVLIPAALINGLAGGLAIAHQRFRLLALIVASSCLGYLVVVLLAVHDLHDLRLLTWLAAAQAGLSAAALLAVGARDLDRREIQLIRRDERRAFSGYAWRTQLANSAALINTELDAVIIAIVLPVRTVGVYAIGAGVAAAVRSLPLYAVPPLRSSMSTAFGSGGVDALRADYARQNRTWVDLVIRYSAVTIVSTPYCVLAWLGRDFGRSATVATILVICFSINVTTAVTAAFVQAIGRADLESRYGIVAVVINLVLTVPLAIGFGLFGVVAATGFGAVAASIYFYWLVAVRLDTDRSTFWPGSVPWSALAIAAGVLVAQEGLLLCHLSAGRVWLVLALATAIAGLAACIIVAPATRQRAGSRH